MAFSQLKPNVLTAILGLAADVLAEITKIPSATPAENYDDHIKDYIYTMRHFNDPHEDDLYLDRERYRLLRSSVKRLNRLHRTVGHGNFCLPNSDDQPPLHAGQHAAGALRALAHQGALKGVKEFLVAASLLLRKQPSGKGVLTLGFAKWDRTKTHAGCSITTNAEPSSIGNTNG